MSKGVHTQLDLNKGLKEAGKQKILGEGEIKRKEKKKWEIPSCFCKHLSHAVVTTCSIPDHILVWDLLALRNFLL